jgi:hypothetical protein
VPGGFNTARSGAKKFFGSFFQKRTSFHLPSHFRLFPRAGQIAPSTSRPAFDMLTREKSRPALRLGKAG